MADMTKKEIGRVLHAHFEKLLSLKSDLERGAHSLDTGLGKEISIEAIIAEARGRNPNR